jgi:hypothetical protein
MPVSPAHVTTVTTVTSTDDELPGLLEVLGRVPDPRRRRGRRYTLVFLLAVAVACVLAGARNFREIGDQASDLPQEVLARLGGRPHPLLRTIIAPSEKRIRTVLQEIDAATLDALTGGWLRGLADAGRLQNLLRAIAIDGKWLRGIGDGQQVKLFAAMLHEEKVIIAQHAIPEDTNEITQVRELLDPVDLNGAVVTGDAAHAQRDTAAYIAGPEKDGGRESDYFLFVSNRSTGCAIPHTGKIPAPATAAAGRRSWPPAETSRSACSTSRASPRSTALSRPSDATGPACSATYRYKTRSQTTLPIPCSLPQSDPGFPVYPCDTLPSPSAEAS